MIPRTLSNILKRLKEQADPHPAFKNDHVCLAIVDKHGDIDQALKVAQQLQVSYQLVEKKYRVRAMNMEAEQRRLAVWLNAEEQTYFMLAAEQCNPFYITFDSDHSSLVHMLLESLFSAPIDYPDDSMVPFKSIVLDLNNSHRQRPLSMAAQWIADWEKDTKLQQPE